MTRICHHTQTIGLKQVCFRSSLHRSVVRSSQPHSSVQIRTASNRTSLQPPVMNPTNSKAAALLSLIGLILLWPYVLTKSVPSGTSLAEGHGEESPHVVKKSAQECESSFDTFCLNNGQCILLADINEHHCRCGSGFYGPRCNKVELVVQPMKEEQIIVTIFCVGLLIVGLSGALYLCCKWYNKRHGYKGVQTA